MRYNLKYETLFIVTVWIFVQSQPYSLLLQSILTILCQVPLFWVLFHQFCVHERLAHSETANRLCSMPLRGHYTLQSDYNTPCVGKHCKSMCCCCQCPSACVGNDWCTCIHAAGPLWIHISEAQVWPFQLASVYMGKCQSSEQRWMCYLTDWPFDSSLLQKKKEKRKHFRSQGKCPLRCENMCKNK